MPAPTSVQMPQTIPAYINTKTQAAKHRAEKIQLIILKILNIPKLYNFHTKKAIVLKGVVNLTKIFTAFT